MFDDELQAAVPETESPQSDPDVQTDVLQEANQTQDAPTEPSATQPNAGLTKEDVAAIIREQLQMIRGEFATREEVSRASQTASDKRFARLMKELAPEIKGIDLMVKRGMMDADQAAQAKKELFAEKAVELAGQDELPEPDRAPAQQTSSQADLRTLANNLLARNGLTWDDFPRETLPPTFEEFAALVVEKAATRKAKQGQVSEQEQRTRSVREADRQGATRPPAATATPERKPKPTLDDADDLADALVKRFYSK